MELTHNIKDHNCVKEFLEMVKNNDYVEVLFVEEADTTIPEEHQLLLEKRLASIEKGAITFKSWDDIKKKYANKTV